MSREQMIAQAQQKLRDGVTTRMVENGLRENDVDEETAREIVTIAIMRSEEESMADEIDRPW